MEVAGDRGAAAAHRALQARHLCQGDRGIPRPRVPGRLMARKRVTRPPVVMIHGAFCGGWVFEAWRARFAAAGYKVLTPTLRYHESGEQPRALGSTSVLDYAKGLEALIDTLDAPPILIGHSLG